METLLSGRGGNSRDSELSAVVWTFLGTQAAGLLRSSTDNFSAVVVAGAVPNALSGVVPARTRS